MGAPEGAPLTPCKIPEFWFAERFFLMRAMSTSWETVGAWLVGAGAAWGAMGTLVGGQPGRVGSGPMGVLLPVGLDGWGSVLTRVGQGSPHCRRSVSTLA